LKNKKKNTEEKPKNTLNKTLKDIEQNIKRIQENKKQLFNSKTSSITELEIKICQNQILTQTPPQTHPSPKVTS
jgi:phosphoenolpyruvate-protein kinase (PTS system EI component)